MSSALQIACVAFVALFDAIFADQLTTAFGHPIANGQIITACLLIVFVIIGNYLGTMRPNYLVGLRTPWTLESEATWRATRRLGGGLMFFGALLLVVLDFFPSQSTLVFLLVTFVLVFCIWTFSLLLAPFPNA
jgi:immunity protein, SdpI family